MRDETSLGPRLHGDDIVRPLTILIAALGGEGGAVLADWLLAVATDAGYPVQSTSIPGVAQRTGATTYYLELYPVRAADLGGMQPVFALTPSPGNVDLMVASELVEAGRAMQNGYVTSRTTLIAATHRIFATSEKMQSGDGRFDASRILAAGPRLAGRALFADLAAMAQSARTVISSVLFGAIAGSGALPFTREKCEAAIRAGGVGVESSLRGFAAGFAAARGEAGQQAQPGGAAPVDAPNKSRLGGVGAADPSSAYGGSTAAALPDALARRVAALPAAARDLAGEGVRRALDYQDALYAASYLDRVDALAAQPGATPELIRETARFLALWMCYEDIARVAQLKTKPARFGRVRSEAGARDGEPVRVVEYLRPGVAEVADMLPPGPAAWLRRRAAASAGVLIASGGGIHVDTASITGYALLRALSALRRIRRASSRFRDEQQRIAAWLASIQSALGSGDAALALELALCARLIKGYGDTHERGIANFTLAVASARDESIAPAARAAAVRAAREAALAIGGDGSPSRAPKATPIRFMPRRPRGA